MLASGCLKAYQGGFFNFSAIAQLGKHLRFVVVFQSDAPQLFVETKKKERVNIRILRVYLAAVTPHNSTFEPHFAVFHYLEWIRNAKIIQNPVVNSQNHCFFSRF